MVDEWNMPISKPTWDRIARYITVSLSRHYCLSRDDCEGYAQLGMVRAAGKYDPQKSPNAGGYIYSKGRLYAIDELRAAKEVFRDNSKHRLRDIAWSQFFDLRHSDDDDDAIPSSPERVTQPELPDFVKDDLDVVLRDCARTLSDVEIWLMREWLIENRGPFEIGRRIGKDGYAVYYLLQQAAGRARYELGRWLLGMNHKRGRASCA